MAGTTTRSGLLEQGALLFARHGVHGVSTRQLHEAIGARNESALHYHFGDRDGLVAEILRQHLSAVEDRRAPLVAAIASSHREGDLRALVHALAAPMAADLATPVGRAHLRLVAQLSHPALAYGKQFNVRDAPAGKTVVRWLVDALEPLPAPIRTERLAALRSQLISMFGLRAQLLDEPGPGPGSKVSPTELFVDNLLDQLVAGLVAAPSEATLATLRHNG